MNTTTGRPWRRSLTGIAALALAGTGLLAPARAAASQVVGDGAGTGCDLATWYAVHNPSLAKPRGHQDLPDHRTSPTGPCPR